MEPRWKSSHRLSANPVGTARSSAILIYLCDWTRKRAVRIHSAQEIAELTDHLNFAIHKSVAGDYMVLPLYHLLWQEPIPYINQISVAKREIFGHPFWLIFDSFFEPFLGRQFPTPEMSFSSAVWHPNLVPKTAPKYLQNRDPEIQIQPVICVLENGVRPVRGSRKWSKNGPTMVQKESTLRYSFQLIWWV